jgi:dTDP-4-dehydrorhamnose reductase
MVETSQVTEREIAVWAILGGHGQLGCSFRDVLTVAGIPFYILSRTEADITDRDGLVHSLTSLRPTVIVNCAAWTAVDNAEDFASEAFAINAEGARNVAIAARTIGARLVHISTDYVFPGDEVGARNEDAATGPSSVYGASKLAGEEAVISEYSANSLIVRTAWLYSKYGGNFVKTMVRKALTSSEVRVVNDQNGQPTLATDLAEHVVELVQHNEAQGIFHGTNSGSTTWYDLTRAIYEMLGVSTSLVSPVDSFAYPTKARRPSNSVLGHQRTMSLGIPEMRTWLEALAASLPEIADLLKKELAHES